MSSSSSSGVTIDAAAAVFQTDTQVTLESTFSGLVSPVTALEDLEGILYVSHPRTEASGDLFQNNKVYDGIEMCQHGIHAPYLDLVANSDNTGFQQIEFQIDLLKCAQRYEYQELDDCECVWDDVDMMYKTSKPPGATVCTEGEQCAFPFPEENRDVDGNVWQVQLNFVHCAVPVPDNRSGQPGDDLLEWISLFSKDNTGTNDNFERDALAQMFPNYYGPGEPLTRIDMYYGTSYLSQDFQAVLYDWTHNGCEGAGVCVGNPFDFSPYPEGDGFIALLNQRCFNVQVPLRVDIPTTSDPLVNTDGIEFALGTKMHLGAPTSSPTLPTALPTTAPTAPTALPTSLPTGAPVPPSASAFPTRSPTQFPTNQDFCIGCVPPDGSCEIGPHQTNVDFCARIGDCHGQRNGLPIYTSCSHYVNNVVQYCRNEMCVYGPSPYPTSTPSASPTAAGVTSYPSGPPTPGPSASPTLEPDCCDGLVDYPRCAGSSDCVALNFEQVLCRTFPTCFLFYAGARTRCCKLGCEYLNPYGEEEQCPSPTTYPTAPTALPSAAPTAPTASPTFPHQHTPHDHAPHDHAPHDHSPHDHGAHDHTHHEHNPQHSHVVHEHQAAAPTAPPVYTLPPSVPPTTLSPTFGWVVDATAPWPVLDRSPADNSVLIAILISVVVGLSALVFWLCSSSSYKWRHKKTNINTRGTRRPASDANIGVDLTNPVRRRAGVPGPADVKLGIQSDDAGDV